MPDTFGKLIGHRLWGMHCSRMTQIVDGLFGNRKWWNRFACGFIVFGVKIGGQHVLGGIAHFNATRQNLDHRWKIGVIAIAQRIEGAPVVKVLLCGCIEHTKRLTGESGGQTERCKDHWFRFNYICGGGEGG